MRRVLQLALLFIPWWMLVGVPSAHASTTLYCKQPLSSAPSVTAYKYLSLTRSVLTFITSVTNKINGTTQDTLTAGGAVFECVSPPLSASATISGTITYNTWVKTSSTTGTPKTVARAYSLIGGVETQFSTKTSTLVQSTSIQNDNFTDTAPTSTPLSAGDRITFKIWVASTSATGTETVDYGGKTAAADGETFITFTENLSFESEPEFIQQINAFATASGATVAATLPGATAAGNLILTWSTWNNQAQTASVSDGSSYTSIVAAKTYSTLISQPFFRANVAGATYTVTLTTSGSNTLRTISVAEYGGMSASPFDVTASVVATGTSTAPLSNASGTTNFTNELLVGFLDYNGSSTPAGGTPASGWVLRTTSDGNAIQDKSVIAIGSYTTGSTITSNPWIMTIATFKWGTQPVSNCVSFTALTLLGTGCM